MGATLANASRRSPCPRGRMHIVAVVVDRAAGNGADELSLVAAELVHVGFLEVRFERGSSRTRSSIRDHRVDRRRDRDRSK